MSGSTSGQYKADVADVSVIDSAAKRDSPTSVGAAIVTCYLTSLPVFLGVLFGSQVVTLCTLHGDSTSVPRETVSQLVAAWDGVWYHRIVDQGYSYTSSRMSNVAFYPMYPVTARLISRLTTLSAYDSLLLASHLYLIGAFALLVVYLKATHRHPVDSALTLVVFGLFPTTFWMRMSYSESTFLFVLLAAMVAMSRRWNCFYIAFLVGLSTAARPVGVALVLPYVWHLWETHKSCSRFLARALMTAPICVWGIMAYILFQWWAFDEPLAFIKTQSTWIERPFPKAVSQLLVDYCRFEPLWVVYVDGSPYCWKDVPPKDLCLFNMRFLNPVFFSVAAILVAAGSIRKVITTKELLLGVGLLAVPYFTHAYRACMVSEARYASVVFPAYIVLASALRRLPFSLALAFLVGCAVFLCLYSALFTQWYWIY